MKPGVLLRYISYRSYIALQLMVEFDGLRRKVAFAVGSDAAHLLSTSSRLSNWLVTIARAA